MLSVGVEGCKRGRVQLPAHASMTRQPLSVHLVRHGHVHNPDNVIYGRLPGFGLSAQGRRQVAHTARWLQQRGRRLLVISSPLRRALETAEILATLDSAQPEIERDVRLQEAGSWRQGLPRRWAPAAYFRAALSHQARAQQEPSAAIAARMREAIIAAAAAAAGQDLVLVSHQRPIGLALLAFTRGLGTPYASWPLRLAPGAFVGRGCRYASVTTLHLRAGAFQGFDVWEPPQ